MAERRCRHYSSRIGRRCGAFPARRFVEGWRCAPHTRSALAGRPEPGCGPECAPAACRCPRADGWWQYLALDVQDVLQDVTDLIEIVERDGHPREVALVLRQQDRPPRSASPRTALRAYAAQLDAAGFATRTNTAAAVFVTYADRHP